MSVALYVSVFTLILFWLSIKVIENRRKHKVSVGDGGVEELRIAMAVQSNAVEYLPIGLLLMLVLELNGAGKWLIHAFGVTLIAGRYFHYRGMFDKKLRLRVLGMKLTLYALLALAVANLVCLPYSRII
jgi:uncharacterized membrane protein YecN with MAPEG domain